MFYFVILYIKLNKIKIKQRITIFFQSGMPFPLIVKLHDSLKGNQLKVHLVWNPNIINSY